MNRVTGGLLFCVLITSFTLIETVAARTASWREPTRFEYDHEQQISPDHYEKAPRPDAGIVLPPVVNVTPDNTDVLTINLANRTEIEQAYIQAFYLRGERDGDILLKTIDDLRRNLRDLSNVASELQKVSDDSLLQPIPVREFLDSVRTFTQESNLFLEDVNNLEHFPTLRPDITADPDSQVDMLPLVHQYQSTLRKLDSQVSQLHFNIVLPSGMLHQQLGISSDQLKSMSLFTAEQIADMKRNVLQLRAMRTQDKRVIDEGINRFTKDAIETFIDTFGTSERYRSISDPEGSLRAKEMLIDAFWARSYIRATYGIQIGCIPVEYDKRIFNLDYYLSDMTVGAAPVYDQNKLMRYGNLAQEAMVTIENSASKRWLSVSSWLTWVAGKSNEMDTKYFIIALIKKDIDEELAISRSGGLRKVRDGYRQHYLSSDMGRALYQFKARQVFSSSEALDDDIESDVMMVEAGTLKGAVAMCINALENQENRLDEARKLQSVVDMLTRDNVISERRKKRHLF
ncbi:hypothetical protein [Endozoicomonas sp. SCSIO W0465]|uniref:hypothetical protein n=1 Tax=Endozoicomonas sp. SCSIO W0465 TaxID=2918516 RepID=UPI0020750683|nr:hypothetical protein [Endozoicomonas sp. SCSIO W0465]USE34028.1 hypothetical protein MJO57_17860 [Endozoicomonas sp. SCSIO W0465]